jgi:hypothetical protein
MWRLAAGALATVLFLTWFGHFTYTAGVNHSEALHLAAQVKQDSANLRGVQQAEKITAEVGEAHEVTAATQAVIYRTLTKEIPVYVPAEVVDAYPVPAGLVRLLDAAAAGVPAVPLPAGQSYGAPSGVGLDRLSDVTVDNYRACNGYRSTLMELQDWNQQQAARAVAEQTSSRAR